MKNEWIKCSERLPREGEYLISDGIIVGIGYFDHYNCWNAPSFVSPTYDMSGLYLEFPVLYWSDIPTPPQE